MKTIVKVLVLPTILFACASAATASTLTLGSWGSANAANPGVANTAMTYLGYNATPNGTTLTLPGGSAQTYNISNGSDWSAAIGASSWVSETAKSGPGGYQWLPNGDYYYETTFNIDPNVNATGAINVLADDTAQVWLNGHLLENFANTTSYPHCATAGTGITCKGDGTPVSFDGFLLTGQQNTLVIIDGQRGSADAGLDFSGTVTEAAFTNTPEPSSLLFLGTGLIGLAGGLLRKAKASRMVAHLR
jgi:hypothetical protein